VILTNRRDAYHVFVALTHGGDDQDEEEAQKRSPWGNGRDLRDYRNDKDEGEVDGGRLRELLPEHERHEREQGVLGGGEFVLGKIVGFDLVPLKFVEVDGRVGRPAALLMLPLVSGLLDLRVDRNLGDFMLQRLLHLSLLLCRRSPFNHPTRDRPSTLGRRAPEERKRETSARAEEEEQEKL
jgi:hypothetical protein